jgi:hypothetical protein
MNPITPPPQLVQHWVDLLETCSDQKVFTVAVQWGANQELEACCSLLELSDNNAREYLQSARRLKFPELGETVLPPDGAVEPLDD